MWEEIGDEGEAMTPGLTAQQIRDAEERLWHEGRQRDYGPGHELIGNDRVVSAALRAYADLLARIASGDAVLIEKVGGKWPLPSVSFVHMDSGVVARLWWANLNEWANPNELAKG